MNQDHEQSTNGTTVWTILFVEIASTKISSRHNDFPATNCLELKTSSLMEMTG